MICVVSCPRRERHCLLVCKVQVSLKLSACICLRDKFLHPWKLQFLSSTVKFYFTLSAFVFELLSHLWSPAGAGQGKPTPRLLFHATSQHLISCNEHDADDERNGERAYQAFAHTSLLDLLRRAGA